MARATLLAMLLCVCSSAFAGRVYTDAAQLESRIRAIAAAHPGRLEIGNLATSPEGRPVWLLTIAPSPDPAEKRPHPAMLVAAGIEGDDLAGTASTLFWTEKLLNRAHEPAIKEMLARTTIYIIPRLNPDSAERAFGPTRHPTAANTRPFDDDHDGLTDEDGPEDLNGDGALRSARIEDPAGEFIIDADEPRLMVKADAAKGEAGAWRVITEGRDNDGDELWNEDGEGGVNLNRNFPFNYEFFAANAGPHQVSEPETRALADFMVRHPEIALVFTFGANDNLTKAPAAAKDDKKEEDKPASGMMKGDQEMTAGLGKLYRDTLGLTKELDGAERPGTFADWVYYHRGRIALSTPAWTPELQLALEPASGDKKEKKDKDGDKDKPGNDAQARPLKMRAARRLARAFFGAVPAPKPAEKPDPRDPDRNKAAREWLGWLDANAPEMFAPWTALEHPDFPGKRAEVGGLELDARINPPPYIVQALMPAQADFLTTLTLRLPRPGFRKIDPKPAGRGIVNVEVEIENTGFLPDVPAQGERTSEVLPSRLIIDLPAEAILAGTRVTKLEPIRGSGGSRRVRYTLHLPEKREVTFTLITALGGTATKSIKLGGD